MLVQILLSWLCLAACVSTARDSLGKEFIIGFMSNKVRFKGREWADRSNDIELFITTVSNEQVEVKVTTPLFDPDWMQTVTVTRGTIQVVNITSKIRGSGTEKANKGVWIQATEEVSVFAVNKEDKSTDAYISLPVDVLWTEYYALTYVKDAELLVVATEDKTRVSIQWPKHAGNCEVVYDGVTYGNGDTLTVALDRFETFHVLQLHYAADFTGAHIHADKPVGVISGNQKSPVPEAAGTADHLTEMLMPVNTWGKTFLTSSTPDRTIGDVFRVLASEDDTTISLSNGVMRTIDKAGDFWELNLETGDYQTVTSTKPVMVAMFSKTYKNDGPHFGDPSMSLLIPEPQYASDYTWSSVKDPSGAEFDNKVAVVIDEDKVDGLRLDGHEIEWEEKAVIQGSDGKMHLWARVTPGPHNIYHSDTSVTFLAIVSGTYKVNSYAYAAGLRLAPINSVCQETPTIPGDILDNDCDGRIDEEKKNGIDDDGDGAVDEDLALSPRVDGNWGGWGPWGQCRWTCSRTRTRACDDPPPANNGVDCPGPDSQEEACHTGDCPRTNDLPKSAEDDTGDDDTMTTDDDKNSDDDVATDDDDDNDTKTDDDVKITDDDVTTDDDKTNFWGPWNEWSECNSTCETGVRFRRRTCDVKSEGDGVKSGGDDATSDTEAATLCPGPDEEMEKCSQQDACAVSDAIVGNSETAAITGAVTAGLLVFIGAAAGCCLLFKVIGRRRKEEEERRRGIATTDPEGYGATAGSMPDPEPEPSFFTRVSNRIFPS